MLAGVIGVRMLAGEVGVSRRRLVLAGEVGVSRGGFFLFFINLSHYSTTYVSELTNYIYYFSSPLLSTSKPNQRRVTVAIVIRKSMP